MENGNEFLGKNDCKLLEVAAIDRSVFSFWLSSSDGCTSRLHYGNLDWEAWNGILDSLTVLTF